MLDGRSALAAEISAVEQLTPVTNAMLQNPSRRTG
jgi:hypothetical protein